LRRAEAGACATRRQAHAQREGRRLRWRVFSILVKEVWLGKTTIAGPSAHPPACPPAVQTVQPRALALPLSSHPFFAPSSRLAFRGCTCVLSPSSNLCLLLLLALPPRLVLPFYSRVVQAAACKPLGPRVGVWSSSPSLLCLLFSPMLPILSFSNACTRAAPYVPRRAAPYVLRHAVRATPCGPRRACHAVRGQICLKDVFYFKAVHFFTSIN
jgi:hypothetical protein